MKNRVCFCPESLTWIRKHLMKSARSKFNQMISGQVKSIIKRRTTKRRFSRKQLAAQRLFAKRARAGTLRRRKRRVRK